MSNDKHLRCSFCGKSKDSVRKFISGPSVYICNECITLCNEILAEDEERDVADTITQVPTPERDQGGAGPVRDRAGAGQAHAVGRGLQPLQADQLVLRSGERGRARQVQYPADRPHRRRQDPAGPDPRPNPRRSLHHRRRHHPHRGGLRRRGRGEHPGPAAPGRGIQRRGVRAGYRLHRRDRQDRPQVGEPEHHPGRFRARACSRPCSRFWKARWPRFRPRAAASTRSRSTSRSTPRTSCSSAAAPSTGWRRSSRPAPAGSRSASPRIRAAATARRTSRTPSPKSSRMTCCASG